MRCTQFIGLSEDAKQWLDTNCIKLTFLEYVTREYLASDGSVTKVEQMKPKKYCILASEDTQCTLMGMFGEPSYTCKQYATHEGSPIEEFLQAEPWSSGPMQFLALRFRNNKQVVRASLWTDAEMEGY